MHILLLTATVNPRPQPNLVVTDASIRRKQYEDALSFYLQLPDSLFDRIIFLENSGADLGSFRKQVEASSAPSRVSFLQLDGTSYPLEFQRGYAELRLIRDGIAELFRQRLLDANDVLWKVTGRYQIMNMTSIVQTAPPFTGIYCDFKKLPARWLDMRVMGFTPEYFCEIVEPCLHLIEDMKGAKAAEIVLYDYLVEREDWGEKVIPRLRVQPDVAGVCGFNGVEYSEGASKRLKFVAKSISRKLFPWIWI